MEEREDGVHAEDIGDVGGEERAAGPQPPEQSGGGVAHGPWRVQGREASQPRSHF